MCVTGQAYSRCFENLLQILRENTEKISSLNAENARLKELTKTVSGTSNTQPKIPPIPAPRRAPKNPSIPVENQEPAFDPAVDPTGMQNTRGNNYASRPRPKMRRRNRKTQMEVHPTATEKDSCNTTDDTAIILHSSK